MKWRSLQESATEVDRRSLREQFAERKQLINKYLPPDVQAIHTRAIAEIIDNGLLDRGGFCGQPCSRIRASRS